MKTKRKRRDFEEKHIQQILANERAAGRVANVEIKPHGRMAWNLYMHEGQKWA